MCRLTDTSLFWFLQALLIYPLRSRRRIGKRRDDGEGEKERGEGEVFTLWGVAEELIVDACESFGDSKWVRWPFEFLCRGKSVFGVVKF